MSSVTPLVIARERSGKFGSAQVRAVLETTVINIDKYKTWNQQR